MNQMKAARGALRLTGRILALLAGLGLVGALSSCELYVHDYDHHHHDYDHRDYDHHDHDRHDHNGHDRHDHH